MTSHNKGLLIVAFIIALCGVWLISDLKVISGILLLLWGNNIERSINK